MKNLEKELSAALRAADVVVSYTPLPDEPNPDSLLFAHGFRGQVVKTPQDKNASPEEFVALLLKSHKDKRVCVVVPGRKFDAEGTRVGRGGGWYDKFLSAIPKEWPKIGMALPHHFSAQTLERKKWDQPMDYVLVYSDEFEVIVAGSRHK